MPRQSPVVLTRTRALATRKATILRPYNYPSGYSYPTNSSYPAGSGYYPNRYGYGSGGDYNRNYGGTRSGPQVTFTLP